jgi:hypothetical protein
MISAVVLRAAEGALVTEDVPAHAGVCGVALLLLIRLAYLFHSVVFWGPIEACQRTVESESPCSRCLWCSTMKFSEPLNFELVLASSF